MKLFVFVIIVALIVSPRKGRWIEMIMSYRCQIVQVSPRKGRWIEIFLKIFLQLSRVSPRKGRWIEIWKEKKMLAQQSFSP